MAFLANCCAVSESMLAMERLYDFLRSIIIFTAKKLRSV